VEDSGFEMTEIVKAYLLVGHRKKAVEVSSWNIAKRLQWYERLPTHFEKGLVSPARLSREHHDAPSGHNPAFQKEDNGWERGVSEMSSVALLQSLKESILSQANVKAIYGEPIAAQGKTVVPVAKIMYAYGAGAGTGGVGNTSARGEGGGGGGGVRAIPVGVIEISDQQTRFVPITDRKKLTGAVLAGIALGMCLTWRRRR
jgi:uncharacterized spore protein YtfJ